MNLPSVAARTKSWRVLAAESSRCPNTCLRVHPPGRQGESARVGERENSLERKSSSSVRKLRASWVGMSFSGWMAGKAGVGKSSKLAPLTHRQRVSKLARQVDVFRVAKHKEIGRASC